MFLLLLSTLCEVVTLPQGSLASEAGQCEEAMHIVCVGSASVRRGGGGPEVLPRGGNVGAEAALGLRCGPPGYSLAGEEDCILVRLEREAVACALRSFPQQLAPLLGCVGVDAVPEDHPWRGWEGDLWETAPRA